tara:strand:+ start:23929 stop:24264 length:336 start_codon:yes stop_codon:yes gene_type:complete
MADVSRGLTGGSPVAKAIAMAETQKQNMSDIPPETLSFEDALRELETIVQQLERGDVALDASIALYARGETLRAQCQKRLADAEARIEKLTMNPSGDASGVPGGVQPFSAI